MRLSIVIPTFRSDFVACSRIFQACSWATPELEVVVRDNSGDAKKRNLLSQIARENCRIEMVEPCGPVENYSEALRLANGEFVFIIADDDLGFDRGIAAIPSIIAEHANNPSVVGIAGTYAIEQTDGSAIVGYQHIDSEDVVTRVTGYLSHQGVNALVYSPVRRELLLRVFDFISALPFRFSFHDQITCLLYLLNGRFARLKRLMYLYDIGGWGTAEAAQSQDVAFYTAAGLDPAINKLHWFLCGFEGAVLICNSGIVPNHPQAQRQAIADRWFSAMYMRFRSSSRQAPASALLRDADQLCQKWNQAAARLSFEDILADIAGFLALSSAENAEKYRAYWSAVLAEGAPPRN